MLLLRVVLFLHALAVLTQAAFAGQFLSGVDAQVVFHEWTGWAIFILSAMQVTVALVLLLKSAVPLWFLVASLFMVIAEALQLATGYGRFLGVHIPLGVLVFGAVTGLLLWSFRRKPAFVRKEIVRKEAAGRNP